MSHLTVGFFIGFGCAGLISISTVYPHGAIAAAIFAGCALIAIAIKER